MQDLRGRIAGEVEEIISYSREEDAGVNLESVMQDENDNFELLLDDTPVARRHEGLHE